MKEILRINDFSLRVKSNILTDLSNIKINICYPEVELSKLM